MPDCAWRQFRDVDLAPPGDSSAARGEIYATSIRKLSPAGTPAGIARRSRLDQLVTEPLLGIR